MSVAEGIIRFAYDLQNESNPVADADVLAELDAWRHIFRRLGLIGQDPERYDGYGFGNLSARDQGRDGEFVVTASQTGGLERLSDEDVVRITHYSLDRFWVDAVGSQPPSSETMTHAMVYAADPRIRCVFHCHSPEIWQQAQALGLPCTPEPVPYGSTAMVQAVAELLEGHASRPLVFASLGHTDGVFACGPTARDTGGLLVSYLAKALALP